MDQNQAAQTHRSFDQVEHEPSPGLIQSMSCELIYNICICTEDRRLILDGSNMNLSHLEEVIIWLDFQWRPKPRTPNRCNEGFPLQVFWGMCTWDLVEMRHAQMARWSGCLPLL